MSIAAVAACPAAVSRSTVAIQISAPMRTVVIALSRHDAGAGNACIRTGVKHRINR